MIAWWIIAAMMSCAGSLVFATLTYALRGLVRARLEFELARRGMQCWYEPTLQRQDDLIFVTAFLRLVCNLLILIFILHMFHASGLSPWLQYTFALLITAVLAMVFSVTIPHASAHHFGESLIARAMRPLHGLRLVFKPVLGLMHVSDSLVRTAAGSDGVRSADSIESEVEHEILSAVEEGAEQGVVDESEKEMIESVIEFHDRRVAEVMTPRTEIIGLSLGAPLQLVKQTIEESGHSRIPVYEGTIDHIVGVLYARDLLKHVGEPPEKFDIRDAMRPVLYVPDSKPLRDLLKTFRDRKVHMAIVLDEYGGTAGLATIEDVLEQLVGEISDEHEPIEPALFRRISETSAEVDAQIEIDQLNRLLGVSLPEDDSYDTLGGFITTTLGRIPAASETFEHAGARFTVLDAEPMRINRVRIDCQNPSAVVTPAQP
jgi:putative hemolysin